MSTLDTLIAVPLIPLLPVVVTWYLPWERWLPNNLPNWLLGPYLLYASFAAWRFEMPRWVCALIGVMGAALVVRAAVGKPAKQSHGKP